MTVSKLLFTVGLSREHTYTHAQLAVEICVVSLSVIFPIRRRITKCVRSIRSNKSVLPNKQTCCTQMSSLFQPTSEAAEAVEQRVGGGSADDTERAAGERESDAGFPVLGTGRFSRVVWAKRREPWARADSGRACAVKVRRMARIRLCVCVCVCANVCVCKCVCANVCKCFVTA